ncbi:MAG: efflux RND transporter periplasmic adaptor subunit [Bacteroidota bacterium]
MNTRIINIVSIALFFSWVGCGGEQEVTQEPEELVKTINVTTTEVGLDTFNSFVRVVGTVETSDDIMISAEVSGKVIRFYIEEGARVKKGQYIAKIDDAKLTQEKARLEAQTAQAKTSYERLQKVYDEDGIGSEIDVLNAKYVYEQSVAALKSIQVDLENTVIKAPFNAILENTMVEEGEMVTPGMPVVRLIGSDAYILNAGVPARYASAVTKGDEVDYWFDVEANDVKKGVISYVGSSVTPSNRTFSVEVVLPDSKALKVDMIANMRLKTYEQDSVVVVSEEFVYSKDDRYVIYVLGENDEGKTIASEREVELGLSYRTKVIIKDGLTVGEQLITLGSAFLDDGMRVTVKNPENTTLAAQ